MELLVPGYGIVSQDTDKRELLLPGGVVLAEDQEPILGGGGRSLFGLRFRDFNRNRYLFHKATDEGNGPPPPADVPDGGSTFSVAVIWDGYRLARARSFYYQGRNDVAPAVEPPTLAPHIVRQPFRPFRPNRYILSTRRDDTFTPPVEPPTKPPHPPHGKPFRRDGDYGFNDGRGFRRNRYIWNSSVEGPVLVAQPATATPFFVRVRYRTYAQNRHLFHYYYTQPAGPPPSFLAGIYEETTFTINMRRIDRGVIA